MEITSHSVVKNEPFLYYSIMSVYNHVDKIFLCDTGTDDYFCLSQIDMLLDIDRKKENKIDFSRIKIASKIGHKWSSYDINSEGLYNPALTGVETIRQMQIDQTETPFFMILDGDEVWYDYSMEEVKKAINNWDYKNSCGFVNNIFMNTINSYFMIQQYGRIFVTKNTKMDGAIFPSEMHIDKRNDKPMNIGINSVSIDTSYLHYEVYLKPNRRPVTGKINLIKYLPEAMNNFPLIYLNYNRDEIVL